MKETPEQKKERGMRYSDIMKWRGSIQSKTGTKESRENFERGWDIYKKGKK